MQTNKGNLSLTYEELALLLGLEQGSIQKVGERGKRIFIIHGDSQKGAAPYFPGTTMTNTRRHFIMANCPLCGKKLLPAQVPRGGLRCENGHSYGVSVTLTPEKEFLVAELKENEVLETNENAC